MTDTDRPSTKPSPRAGQGRFWSAQRFQELYLMLSILIAVGLYALVLVLYWRWFIVPLGVRDISYWHGLGIALFVNFLKRREPGVADREERKRVERRYESRWTEYLLGAVSNAAYSLLSGWLVHLVMTR